MHLHFIVHLKLDWAHLRDLGHIPSGRTIDLHNAAKSLKVEKKLCVHPFLQILI